MDRERNLLFGLLAAKLGDWDSATLGAVVRDWSSQPEASLPKHFVDAGVMPRREAHILWSLVKHLVKLHEGDGSVALAAFGGEEAAYRALSERSQLEASDGSPARSPKAPLGGLLGEDAGTVEEVPDRYREIEECGRGGMGRVLLVHDEYMDRDVALKELLLDGDLVETPASDDRKTAAYVARFLREARVTGQLSHPSILPVHEVGRRTDGRLYYTMKLVQGRTLSEAIREAGVLSERLGLLSHFADLCQAIAFAHSNGVIHRDIKPANVMIGEFGETVVLDWGLAKKRGMQDLAEPEMERRLSAMSASAAAEEAGTMDGDVLGTPAYMAPEQAAGRSESVDERSDVYALGAVLYEVLTGERPYHQVHPMMVCHEVIEGAPDPILELEPDAPRDLVAICDRGMQKDPERRYQSAVEIADEIERFQSGRRVEAYRYGPLEDFLRFARKHRTVLKMATVCALLVVSLAVVSYVRIFQEKAAAERSRDEAIEARQRTEAEQYAYLVAMASDHIAAGNFADAKRLLFECPREHRNWEWGRLQYLCNLDLLTIGPEAGELVGLSSDGGEGKIITTDPGSRTLTVWDCGDGSETLTVKQRGMSLPGIRAAAFNAKGRCMAALAGDNQSTQLQIWDILTGEQIGTVSTITLRSPCRVVFDQQGETVAWADTRNVSFSKLSELIHRPFASHSDLMYADSNQFTDPGLAFSPKSGRLAVVHGYRVALVDVDTFDHSEGPSRYLVEERGELFSALAYDASGAHLACGTDSGRVFIYDAISGEQEHVVHVHDGIVQAVGLTEGARMLVTAGREGVVRLWRRTVREGEQPSFICVAEHRGHSKRIEQLSLSHDGKRLTTIGRDGYAKVWDMGWNQLVKGQTRLGWGMFCDDLSSPMLRDPWSGEQGTGVIHAQALRQLSADEPEAVPSALRDALPFRLQARSSDGRRLAVVRGDSAYECAVWEVDGEEPLFEWTNPTELEAVALSSDGKMLALGELREPSISVFDVDAGRKVLHFTEPYALMIKGLAFSPDGNRLASFGREELRPGEVDELDPDRDEDRHLPKSRRLIVRLRDTSHGRLLHTENLNSFSMYLFTHNEAIIFSPDGSELWFNCEMYSPDDETETIPLMMRLRAFPFEEEAYPGPADATFRERVEQHKRDYWRARLGDLTTDGEPEGATRDETR